MSPLQPCKITVELMQFLILTLDFEQFIFGQHVIIKWQCWKWTENNHFYVVLSHTDFDTQSCQVFEHLQKFWFVSLLMHVFKYLCAHLDVSVLLVGHICHFTGGSIFSLIRYYSRHLWNSGWLFTTVFVLCVCERACVCARVCMCLLKQFIFFLAWLSPLLCTQNHKCKIINQRYKTCIRPLYLWLKLSNQ